MVNQKQRLGRLAEDAAESFLKRQGYVIVQRNYRTRAAEVDIVAKEADTLVFVEVKARGGFSRGGPREAVSPAKQHKVILGARSFLREHGLDDVRVRFDVVAVYGTNHDFRIELIRNAFQTD